MLVLGGARSGKSELGERLAAATGVPVTYLATATTSDPEMEARIAIHRARRPAEWRTEEVGADLASAVRRVGGTALVDSLGMWLAARDDFLCDTRALCAALSGREGDTIVVSEEVGLGVHPSGQAGRLFRDALGALNRAVADVSDRVLLVVAGRVLEL
jgi:adenosyl cobinamide kinase/adenosyl cobinamide phosphate guanylyltransferase